MKEQFSEMTELGLRFHAYILKTIKNAAENYRKHEEYINGKIVQPSIDEQDAVDFRAAEKSYITQIEKLELKEALEKLPLNYRRALELYYIYGFSNKRITELLGISEVTLIKRKTEAINMLRKYMSEE